MSVTESALFSVKIQNPHLPHWQLETQVPVLIVAWVGCVYTQVIIIMLGEDQLLQKV